jgi:ABC-type spermidine/putrescine transport system permease subunit I
VITDYPAAAALSFLLAVALLICILIYARVLATRNLEEAVI